MTPHDPTILSLDIETYGACQKAMDGTALPQQTVFHPVKSLQIDGVPPQHLVLTCALTLVRGDYWNLPECQPADTMVLDMSLPDHRAILVSWLNHAQVLMGMNLQFDLLYLRAFNPWIRKALNGRHTLIDLGVVNYLNSELRQERSLKTLGPVLSLYSYTQTLKEGNRFVTPNVPQFVQYAAADPHNTVLAIKELARRTAMEYPGSPKLSQECLDFYSRTIWSVIQMSEAGVPMDSKNLESLMDTLLQEATEVTLRCHHDHDLLLEGDGSSASKAKFIERCLDASPDALEHPMLALTERTKAISWSSSNRQLFMTMLPKENPLRHALQLAEQHTSAQKLLSTYLWPLLIHRRSKPSDRSSVLLKWDSRRTASHSTGTLTTNCIEPPSLSRSSSPSTGTPSNLFSILTSQENPEMRALTMLRARRSSARSSPTSSSDSLTRPADTAVYPTWYIVPGRIKGSSSEGGTVQARITAKDPAVQTFPPQIQSAIRSRYRGGTILSADLSQIELRVAGLLSGEESIINSLTNGTDLHSERAKALFGRTEPGSAAWKINRQVGKTINFADLFLASAQTMQMQAYAMTGGTVIPLEVFQQAVKRRPIDRPQLWRFQKDLLDTVDRTSRIVLPILGHSRTFVGGSMAHRSTVVNFPIQTVAANTMLAIQHGLTARLPGLNAPFPKPLISCQIYDAIVFDIPPGMQEVVQEAYAAAIEEVCSPAGYWGRLQDIYEHTVPLGYEYKIEA